MSLQKQSILFINGLDKTVNENMLYMLFNDYSVSYIKIAKDHETRESFGYAFIGFKSHKKAEEAIKKLNYSKLAKKTLRISWFNRDPENYRNKIENNIFVKRIPKDVSAKEFYEYFNKFGHIISAKLAEDEEGETMGFGFVLYDSVDGAKRAIKECNGKEWNGKKLYVSQFIKNRPRKEPKFNNIYVKNIPKVWSENDLKKYFSKYGEIGSMIIREVDAAKLKKELPEAKRKNILNHKYAFVCYKSLDGPAKKAVAKVPYIKLVNNDGYNQKIEEIAKKVNNSGVKRDDMYKSACYILDNELQEKIKSKEELKKIITDFNNLIKENDGVYMAKSIENRLYCCQALKKSEREKKLRQLYERIKRKIKEKYKFCNLYVKNLPSDFTDEKLKELFGKYGEIRSAKIVKREIESNYLVPKKEIKVFGYVCYFEAGKAQEAKQKLKDEALLINGPKLYVDYHQTKKERIEFLKLKLIKKYEKSKNNIPMYPAMMTNMRHFHSFMNQYQKMMPYTDMSREQSFSDGSQQHNSHNKMDLNARNDFFGEKLYIKISHMPQFTKHSNYFSKIVGIFLDLDDNVLEKLIKDDKYFVEQVQETIKLLTEKEKSN